jgi:hypothetical protein
MQHDLQSHQQDRLPRILLCLHGYRQQETAGYAVMQNLQILNTADTRIVPEWLFPTRFSDKNRFTSSRLDAVLVATISAKIKQQQASNEGGRVLRSGRGQLRETGSTSTAPPAATNRSTFSRQHRSKYLSIVQRDIHLIEIKYCEDTRSQHQRRAGTA